MHSRVLPLSQQVTRSSRCIRGTSSICWAVKFWKRASVMRSCSSFSFLSEGDETSFLSRSQIYNSGLYSRFLNKKASFHLDSALFSGMRGGTFMCALARLNNRLKHLLFHTLLKQEVQFFDDNSPGESSTARWSEYLPTAGISLVSANPFVPRLS